MHKRTFLKTSLASLITSTLAMFTNQPAQASQKIRWGYRGDNAPNYWANLSDEYQICAFGHHQSPIDLPTTLGQTTSPPITLAINYHDTPLQLLNNGRTIQIQAATTDTIALEGQHFDLLQFHIHSPSEHTQNGQHYPMEIHLVHRSQTTDDLAVVSVLAQLGHPHPTLTKIWKHIPNTSSEKKAVPNLLINASQILPTEAQHGTQQFFRYSGSLTTPPCTEGVTWLVLATPITVSQQQVDQFVQVIGPNARPIQSYSNRQNH